MSDALLKPYHDLAVAITVTKEVLGMPGLGRGELRELGGILDEAQSLFSRSDKLYDRAAALQKALGY